MEAAAAKRSAERDPEVFVDIDQYGVAGRSPWLDVDWRQYLHTAMVDGREVTYVEYGDRSAPPVVLIHGLAGSWQNWLENIVQLGEDFHVIALDLPGFGASEIPREEISIHNFARTVMGLLDHLDIAKASLVGNSMGGQTAAQAALDFPDRVDKVVLVSPAGYSTSDTPAALKRAAVALGPIVTNFSGRNSFIARHPRLRKIAFFGVVAHGDKLSPEIAYEMMGFSKRTGFNASLQAILNHDFREDLQHIKAPTLIIWGREDGLIGSGDAHRFNQRIPGSKKLIANDTAHVAMIERPAWFNQTVRDFLLTA